MCCFYKFILLGKMFGSESNEACYIIISGGYRNYGTQSRRKQMTTFYKQNTIANAIKSFYVM